MQQNDLEMEVEPTKRPQDISGLISISKAQISKIRYAVNLFTFLFFLFSPKKLDRFSLKFSTAVSPKRLELEGF